MGQWIQLTASDGFQLAAYRAAPAGQDKPRGGLVVVQEIFGVNGHIRSVCDGFAADGYLTVAPALFDRYERNVDIGYTPEDIARGRELKAKASTDAALRDVAAAREAAASAGRVGIGGYCWGGTVAWVGATRIDGLAGAVCYYGGGVTGLSAEKPKCPVMCHWGETDHAIPMDGVRKIEAAQP